MKYVNYKVSKRLTDDPGNWPELNNTHQLTRGEHMNEQQNREDRLWDFIDGLGTDAEKESVEKLVGSDPEWQSSYQELLKVHQLMNSTELEAPSLRFSKNVMEEIAKYQIARATKSYINKKIIWGIGGFFIAMIMGLLVYFFGQIKWAGNSSSDLFSNYNINKLDWSKFFNNTSINIFMMVNVVLGLVLLDMWLQRRKERSAQEEG